MLRVLISQGLTDQDRSDPARVLGRINANLDPARSQD